MVSFGKLFRYLVFASTNSCYNRIGLAYELVRQIELGAVFRNTKTDIFVCLWYSIQFNG